jgi:hypothetical protein
MFDPELESFKYIDLRVYAAAQNYQLDKRESWRGSAVMRHPNGDKIIIKRDAASGHYTYFSVRDDRDNGTIIDFVQFRQNISIGTVRKELRPWIGVPPVPVPVFDPLVKTAKDRMSVEAEYAKMQDARCHPYLENERAIPCELLQGERFAGLIRIDAKGSAAFPHFDQDGLCGFEKKNTAFTGFSSSGTKGLWLSRALPADNRLVLSESAIDALSYALLFPDEHTRYASVGGKLNSTQPELIRAAISRMPSSSEIVAAMDADQAGRDLAAIVRRAVELSGRDDLRFQIHEPHGFKDWNDQLRGRPKPPLPCRPEEPSVA